VRHTRAPPPIVIPTRPKPAVVLEAVKAEPPRVAAVKAASLDRSCAAGV